MIKSLYDFFNCTETPYWIDTLTPIVISFLTFFGIKFISRDSNNMAKSDSAYAHLMQIGNTKYWGNRSRNSMKIKISDRTFKGQDFSAVHFNKSRFKNCIFIDCSFDRTDFSGSSFKDCVFIKCSCNGTRFINVKFECDVDNPIDFQECDFSETTTFKNAKLKNSKFYQNNFNGVDFSGADLSFATIRKVCTNGAIFDKTNFFGVDFSASHLESTDFSKSKNFKYIRDINNAKVDDNTKYPKGKTLHQVLLGTVDMQDYNNNISVVLISQRSRGSKNVFRRNKKIVSRNKGDDVYTIYSNPGEIMDDIKEKNNG